MKGLVLSVCLILAMPIFFVPSGKFAGPNSLEVVACDAENMGNECVTFRREGNRNPREKAGTPQGFVPLPQDLATTLTVFMAWLALR